MSDARERTERSEAVKAERRRRADTTIDGSQRLKLAIPDEVAERLKKEGRTPRWVNDVGNRMVQLTKLDDYDRVEGVEPVKVVINSETGETANAYLLSKPNDFMKEDAAKADERRKEVERALLRGKVPGDSHSHDDQYSSGYVDEASTIQTGGVTRRVGGLGPP